MKKKIQVTGAKGNKVEREINYIPIKNEEI